MTLRASSCLSGLRILVVEDEAIIAMMYEDLLAELGCAVVGPARTVREALDLIASEPPEAVILDGNLNGDLSSPVAVALQAQRRPYLLVTGYENVVVADPALNAAPRVTKPFTPDTLVQAMIRHFC